MKPHSKGNLRVLGVDTSVRSSGVGVVEAKGNSLTSIEHGRIKNRAKLPLSECLKNLQTGMTDLIKRTKPDVAAIEGIFYSRNVKTAVTLGHARGVVIAVCASANIPVFEYAPRRVKQALVGHGAADKEQVRKMVMVLLNLADEPDEDAGDALAMAICHLHNRTRHEMLAPEAI